MSKKKDQKSTIIRGGARKKKFSNGNKIIEVELSWDHLQEFYKKAKDEFFKTVEFKKENGGDQKMILLTLQESSYEHQDYFIVAKEPFVPTKKKDESKKKKKKKKSK